MSIHRKKSGKPKNIYTWIRQRISPTCYGVKTRDGNPVHANKNEDVAYHFKTLKAGWWGRPLSRLSNSDMTDHFTAQKTFYFTADGRSRTKEVLINIDIDCHKSGSLDGAIAFAKHLRETRFPNLYFEVSTNGNGVHGYVVVVKGDLGDEGLNSTLTILDRWLKAELSRGTWDVEDVEVKGQAPEFGWGWGKYELKTYKSGQLAKLPREALERAEELRGTTRVAVEDLRRLPVSARNESVDSVVEKKAKPTLRLVGDKPEKRPGSIAGRHFSEDELARLKGGYLSLSKELLGGTRLVAKGRKVVTEGDLAIFLMLLKFFTLNMNADGSLPVARWKEMWTALFEAGDIDRAWCHHRFAAMRDFLTERDFLSWKKEDYVIGTVNDHGLFIPGEACKWRAGEELMARMDERVERWVDVAREVGSVGKEEGNSILYGCKSEEKAQVEEKEEGESILYGYTLDSSTFIYPNLRQSNPLQAIRDNLGIEIALQRPRFAGFSWGQTRNAA